MKVLFLTDLEGLLMSKKQPEIEGRKYIVVSRTKGDKKVITTENMEKLKQLSQKVDIVPVTKLTAKQCNSVGICVHIPMALVEGGAGLIYGTKVDKKWEFATMDATFNDTDYLHKARKFLQDNSYTANGDNSYTLDYICPDGRNVEEDIEELKKIVDGKYNVVKTGTGRIFIYHSSLSRRAMVQKLIDKFNYDLVISAAAPDTGWLPSKGETISIYGDSLKSKYYYPADLYEKDPHGYASFVLDKAFEIIAENT